MGKVAIRATIINPQSDTKCEYFTDGYLELKYNKDAEAKVSAIGDFKKFNKTQSVEVLDLSGYTIMPSFFDMHFHWVQDDVRLMPKDVLLEWLEKYTFPTEMKFKSSSYAKKRANEFFDRLKKMGTTGGAIYSSIHGHALEHAQKYAYGDFTIGNVLMDMNSPKGYSQSSKAAIDLVAKFAPKYGKKYAVTPRFAPTTSPEVMSETAKIAKKNKCFIQTHLSENKNEISWVLDIYRGMDKFKNVKSYTEIYKKCGVLSAKTLMGHAIHLDDEEIELLRKSKTVLVHCPTSNAPIRQKGLGSGLFNFKRIEKAGLEWAMGSDIGGGPFLSMFDVIESFVRQNKNNKAATYIKGLYRSTLKGAEVMQLAKSSGNLNIGKRANFIILKSKKSGSSAELHLQSLLGPKWKNRESYESLNLATILDGKKLYSSEELEDRLVSLGKF